MPRCQWHENHMVTTVFYSTCRAVSGLCLTATSRLAMSIDRLISRSSASRFSILLKSATLGRKIGTSSQPLSSPRHRMVYTCRGIRAQAGRFQRANQTLEIRTSSRKNNIMSKSEMIVCIIRRFYSMYYFNYENFKRKCCV